MNTDLHIELFRLFHPAGQLKELNRRADLGAIKEKLDDLYTELEDLETDSCADAVAWMSSEIDRMRYGIQGKNFDKLTSTSGD